MVLHTGGAVGADAVFAATAVASGVTTYIHSFAGHNAQVPPQKKGWHIIRHSEEELTKEALPAYEKANTILKKHFPQKKYVQNLILRDYFQVNRSDYVFAVAPLENRISVAGGTGYAVQMAIDRKLPVVVFDDRRSFLWHYFSYKSGKFIAIDHNPPAGFIFGVAENVTGIGSRKITEHGVAAISLLFKSLHAGEKSDII